SSARFARETGFHFYALRSSERGSPPGRPQSGHWVFPDTAPRSLQVPPSPGPSHRLFCQAPVVVYADDETRGGGEMAMGIPDRIKGLLFDPDREWAAIEAEQQSILEIYRDYVLL